MAEKCVHKGCGKVFTDPEEPCIYHPGIAHLPPPDKRNEATLTKG